MTAEYLAVQDFFHACLTERNAEHTLALTDPELSVLGTSTKTAMLDRKAFQAMLEKEFTLLPGPVSFQIRDWKQQTLGENIWNCCFLMDVTIDRNNHPVVFHTLPFSMTLRLRDNAYAICSIHASIPSDELPTISIPQDIASLEASSQKDIIGLLCQLMPGGIIGVYLQNGFPLYMANDTVLSWLGYSYQEFLDCTGGYVERVIHPADRNKVSDAISRQLGHSSCYELDYRLLRKDGDCLWVNDVGRKITLDNGKSILISVLIDTSKDVRDKNILMERSIRDDLTGLYNRRGGQQLISMRLQEFSRARTDAPYLFLIMDIDNFKALNDIYGHHEGDRMLQFVAKLLLKTFRTSDIVFRLGGDEFIIFLPHCPDSGPIYSKITRVCREYREQVCRDYPRSQSSLSLGGIQSGRTFSFEHLYQAADKVLYEVKNTTKDAFHVITL